MSAGPSRKGNGGRGLPSLGQQFIDSEAGQYLIKNRGQFPTGQWTSPASELMAAVLSEDAASGGDLVITDFQPGILPLPMRPPRIEDLIAPGQTDSNTIGYLKETSATNAADTVAEGQPKPESTLIFDAVTDPVRKIPTWIPVTDEMLEDVAQMRSYIDARLRLFVNLALDDQLLNGTTTAPDIVGFPRFDSTQERIRAKEYPQTRIARSSIEEMVAFLKASENLRADAIESAAKVLPQAFHELRKLNGAILQHAEKEAKLRPSAALETIKSAAELMRNNFDILEALSNIDGMRALPLDDTINVYDLAYKTRKVFQERAGTKRMTINVRGVRAIVPGSQKSFPIVPAVLIENAIKYELVRQT